SGNADDFFDGGEACLHPAGAILPHAGLDGDGAQRLLSSAFVSESTKPIVDGKEIVDAGAALVSRVVAQTAHGSAPLDRFAGHIMPRRRLAVQAQVANHSLGKHAWCLLFQPGPA